MTERKKKCGFYLWFKGQKCTCKNQPRNCKYSYKNETTCTSFKLDGEINPEEYKTTETPHEKPVGYPETPNLDKASKIKDQSQRIGEFLEWIKDKHWFFCKYSDDHFQGNMPLPVRYNTQKLIADFFGIDYDAMNKEQEAVFKYVRDHQ